MKAQICVNYAVPTTEAIRLECRNGDNYAEKEIFRVGNNFFFFYIMNRNTDTKTVSLREINQEEYKARKAEIMATRPSEDMRNWTEGDNAYALKIFHNGIWKRILPSNQCIFITESSPLKSIYDETVSPEIKQREVEEAYDSMMKREYAQRCSFLSHQLGINFVNVLRLGHDQKKLMEFQRSYQQALDKVKTLPLRTLRQLHEKMRSGRENRKSALDELKVMYFDADVNIMDFSELTAFIQDSLNAYAEESLKQAAANGAAMSYEQRKSVYERLCKNSRELKRQALSELGIDVEAIEFKRYPIYVLKQKLAATLGIDLEVG